VQPGRERPAAVEAVQSLQRRQERLLRDVLRRLGVVADQPRRPVRRGPVTGEQLGERRLVAPVDRAQQRGVAAPAGGALARERQHERVGLAHGHDATA
jgi:hypothetical protein